MQYDPTESNFLVSHETRSVNIIIMFFYISHKWYFFSTYTMIRAPVFGRHQFFGTSEHYGKAHGSLLSGWMNYIKLHCMLLVSYIPQYFNTSITVLTNLVWKLLIALFKVPNTGALTVIYLKNSIIIPSHFDVFTKVSLHRVIRAYLSLHCAMCVNITSQYSVRNWSALYT